MEKTGLKITNANVKTNHTANAITQSFTVFRKHKNKSKRFVSKTVSCETYL